MKKIKLLLPAIIAFTGIVASTSATYGKAEYTKKEKKACGVCHTPPNSKELNEAGKYYQKNKTLEGYKGAEKK
jgi:hypothetical protein